jgi:pimeloyl-ACP methyl ester carboxylesterase
VRHAQGASRIPVVLLHGLFDDSRGWRDLPDRLARSGHPVILPDLPGHGASPATVNSIDEAEAALVACLPAAGPLILAGHSLGAVLAVRLALRLGPRARRLVLSAPAGLGPRISQDFVDAMMAADSPAALEAALRPLGGGPVSGRALAAELARLQGLRGAIGPLARALAEGGAQKVDLRADLARIECPIAAMFGLEDRILDWRDCAGLPAAAAIHLVAGAGHLPHLAEPALFVDLLTQQDHVAAARPPPARLWWGTEAR